jgi:hypothetical protein
MSQEPPFSYKTMTRHSPAWFISRFKYYWSLKFNDMSVMLENKRLGFPSYFKSFYVPESIVDHILNRYEYDVVCDIETLSIPHKQRACISCRSTRYNKIFWTVTLARYHWNFIEDTFTGAIKYTNNTNMLNEWVVYQNVCYMKWCMQDTLQYTHRIHCTIHTVPY